jgi:hypothetical protein
MRFGLIDLLFAIACISAGPIVAQYFGSILPGSAQTAIGIITGLGIYFALICPVYRIFRLFPMILPQCPCCGSFQPGFHIVGGQYPRIVYRCPGCNGAFVIWHNGSAREEETWDKPVLALKWPYAFGRYCKLLKPEQANTRDRQSQDGL